MLGTDGGGGADARWTPALRAAFAAAARLAGRPRTAYGGAFLPSGPAPTALDDAVWLPAPDRVADLASRGAGEAVLAPPGDACGPVLAEAGYRPVLAVLADDPFGTGRAPAAGPDGGADGGVVGWHAAREVAKVLIGTGSERRHEAPDGDEAGGDGAAGDDAGGDAATPDEDVVAALATALAAAAAEDDHAAADATVALHIAFPHAVPPAVDASVDPAGTPAPDRTSGAAALVRIESEDALVVPLAGGRGEALLARVLAEGRALGKRTVWTRLADADDPAAALVRWERTT